MEEGGEKDLAHIPNQIKLLNTMYLELCHRIGVDDNPVSALSKFVGKALVTF